MTRDLGFYDECSISELLSAAHSLGADSVEVEDYGADSEHFYFDNRPDEVEENVLDFIDGGDIDYIFYFYKGEQILGTFYVVLGNDDGSAVYDSSAQKWCDKVWDAIS